ncbi:hypothetical protein SAMN02910292_02087 [Lachnospiraceae bacterium XBB2008]|nr:hypothetical protein SAMN02910292_02087 [Lachnospiraceae bacterium XBB2008]
MIIPMILFEGIVLSFIILVACVVGIANGPVGLVCLYEREVWDRCIENGLTTEEKIKKSASNFKLVVIPLMLIVVLLSVYGINGARTFWEGFIQMTIILVIEGLFDRLFIDWYWVGKTKAWNIEGTDDLKPYIYGKSLIIKWTTTLVGYPVIAAILAGIMSLIIL